MLRIGRPCCIVTTLEKGTGLDGTTPYVPQNIVSVCGSGTGSGSTTACADCETHNIYDHHDGTCTPFTRKVCFDCASGTATVTDFQVDGVTPYVVLGTAQAADCSLEFLVKRTADSEVLCDDNGSFLRTYTYTADGNVLGRTDTALDGTTAYVPVGAVKVCGEPSGCHDSSIGEVCYTPPVAPGIARQDDWAGAVVTGGPAPGPFTFTNSAFGGSTDVVTATVGRNVGAVEFSSVGMGRGATDPAADNFPVSVDLGAPRTAVTLEFASFGTTSAEFIDTISPPFDTVVGPGVASLGNTRFDPGLPDGTVRFTWNGPVQNISWNWHDSGGGKSLLHQINYTTVPQPGDIATASVLRDCDTGELTYVDLLTGDVVVIDGVTHSFAECPSDEISAQDIADAINTPVALAAQHFEVLPGSPLVPPVGVKSLTYTVLTGTATVTDSDGTVIAGIPAGYSATWSAEDHDTLSPPQSIAADAASRVLVNWVG